ncbi:MAG: LysM peptidoglycan-binding domain-containing protein [Anaerolineales bacterium]
MFFSAQLSKNLIAAALTVVTACSVGKEISNATATSTINLVFFETQTPSQKIDGLEETDIPGPSPTPYYYTVVEGDTLFTIAARLEIELDELLAANPDVDPRFLSPGTQLLIPSGLGIGTALPPIPTPVPVALPSPECFATSAGELWCFVLIENNRGEALENIIASVYLLSSNGELLTSTEAFPPLNLLRSGQAMPLIAYFDEPPPAWVTANADLHSSFAVANPEEHYLDVEFGQTNIEISESGLAAQISGGLEIEASSQPGIIWVLAVAYSEDGEVVGVRRWEGDREYKFDFWVYSLGPKIFEVQLLVEAPR